MCSKWDDGDSYWKGKIVKRIKTIYQIELTDVHVEGAYKIYLNPSECTGKKRLSFEDTPDHNNTLIWVAESCLDWCYLEKYKFDFFYSWEYLISRDEWKI